MNLLTLIDTKMPVTIDFPKINAKLTAFHRWVWKRRCYQELCRLLRDGDDDDFKVLAKKVAERLTKEETNTAGQWQEPELVAQSEFSQWG